jgi:thiol-disulfide isomerase/thioredoxin
MRAALIVLSIVLFSSHLYAKTPADDCHSKAYFTYFNGFLHTYRIPEKSDVALSHAQHLAKACPASLRSLFHTFYAPSFIKKTSGKETNVAERKLLSMLLQDTSQVILRALEPIVLWIYVEENENNPAEIRRLTNAFITTQFQPADWYENRTARYALLIYQIIQSKPELVIQAQVLLTKTITGLQTQLKGYDLPGESVHNWKRAWYRYLYAYSNFLQGEEYKRKGNVGEAEKYYRMAAEYSPDAIDKNSKPGYDYEITFLGTAAYSDGFKEKYLTFLETRFNTTEALKVLTGLALADATHIARLQVFYNQHFASQELFDIYWQKQLKSLPVAPLFTLKQLNSTDFSLEAYKGKWILLDFWGTWCEPCIKEMPKLQAFYGEITSKHADKIVLLTIACNDTELKVKTYLNKNRYNFPVAMADDKIEKSLSISAYPTKILITPQGTMLLLTADNWVEQVKLFCQLKS